MIEHMDEKEQEEILYRLDERTEHMQKSQARVHSELDELKGDVSENNDLAQKNRTLINGLTFGMSSAITVVFARLMEVIQF